MTSFVYVVSIAFHTSVPAFWKCRDTSRKKILLADNAATHAPPAAPLHWTWNTCFPSPLWVVQRHESHWGWGLVSAVDLEDSQRTDLGLLQQLNRRNGAEHCHVGAKHLYSDVHIVWTWLQDGDDSLGDLHTLHRSQCSSWGRSAPKLPLIHPKRESA